MLSHWSDFNLYDKLSNLNTQDHQLGSPETQEEIGNGKTEVNTQCTTVSAYQRKQLIVGNDGVWQLNIAASATMPSLVC